MKTLRSLFLLLIGVVLSGCVVSMGGPSRPYYGGGYYGGYYPPPQVYPVYPAPQTCRRYVQPGGREIYRCGPR